MRLKRRMLVILAVCALFVVMTVFVHVFILMVVFIPVIVPVRL